jgi:hypothetical protein
MKTTTLGTLAAVLMIAMPAYAAKEFDCPPTQEVQSERNETALSEELVEKRKQAREADMARLRARFMRTTTQAVGATEQQTTR